tara:strand:- start:616 stop:846 length:231 start_codon:yes stop_codon:yes gene_type:complete
MTEEHPIVRSYENGEIVVDWKPSLCIHCRNCAEELPRVFQPENRPWIRIGGATSERIEEVVKQCPTQAISVRPVAS